MQFGASTDRSAPGNFAGSAAAELAFFRPSNGTWFIATGGGTTQVAWGAAGDVPALGRR